MAKPVVLQVGAYPQWDQKPLDASMIETRKAMGPLMRDNLSARFAEQPPLAPVL